MGGGGAAALLAQKKVQPASGARTSAVLLWQLHSACAHQNLATSNLVLHTCAHPQVLQLLSDLLSDVGCPPSRAHFTAALREQLGAIERALESGKELPAILTPSGSMGGVGGGLGAAGSLGLGGSGSMGLATSGQLSMSLGTAAASGQVSMSTGTVLF